MKNNVLKISISSFSNCIGLGNVTFGKSVTEIGGYAFGNCDGLKDIKIGNSVTTIGECAFISCDGFHDIVIPDNVISIGSGAFSNCSNMTKITIGKGVTEIGMYAFASLTSLKIFYNRNPIPQVLTNEIFHYQPHQQYAKIYVPVGSVNAYKAANIWSWYIIHGDENVPDAPPVANDAVNREDVEIRPAAGGISISCTRPMQVVIYAISGQMVYRKLVSGNQDIPLGKGMYIVSAKNVTKKIYVK